MSTDRPLTEREYKDFKKVMAQAQEDVAKQEVFKRLVELEEENAILKLTIKVLEDLGVSRMDKAKRLEDTLTKLEQELLKLR